MITNIYKFTLFQTNKKATITLFQGNKQALTTLFQGNQAFPSSFSINSRRRISPSSI